MSSPISKGVAREMYSDSLRFFDEATEQLSGVTLRRPVEEQTQYEERIEAQDEFTVRLTTTHAVLAMFTKRYPEAEFTFHSERNRLPGVSDMDVWMDPLSTQYVDFTVDFKPYGTMFGGSSDDDGGNATQAFGRTGEQAAANRMEASGINVGPSGPSGPSALSTQSAVASPA